MENLMRKALQKELTFAESVRELLLVVKRYRLNLSRTIVIESPPKNRLHRLIKTFPILQCWITLICDGAFLLQYGTANRLKGERVQLVRHFFLNFESLVLVGQKGPSAKEFVLIFLCGCRKASAFCFVSVFDSSENRAQHHSYQRQFLCCLSWFKFSRWLVNVCSSRLLRSITLWTSSLKVFT